MNDRADRARQFMPFATLRGFYDLIREKERVVEPRRIRSDEENARIDRKLNQVRRGMMVKLTYYNRDAYETVEGMVSNIDTVFRTVTIVKTKIPLDDIYDISAVLCIGTEQSSGIFINGKSTFICGGYSNFMQMLFCQIGKKYFNTS